MLIMNFGGQNYSLIGLIIILIIFSIFLLFKVVSQFYEFYTWKTEVNEYIGKGKRYKDAIVILTENKFCFESETANEKTTLSYERINKIDRFENRIVLYEGADNSFLFPKKAFKNEGEFDQFCNLIEASILNLNDKN